MPQLRPRIRKTTGGIPLPRLDGRTVPMRRFKALSQGYEAELNGHPSPIQSEAIEMLASLALHREFILARLAAGETVPTAEITELSRAASDLLALFKAGSEHAPA